MNTEELDKYAEEVKNRSYMEYAETSDEELKEILDEKEINKLEGKGLFNKIAKHFRDKKQAKVMEEVDSLVDNIEKSSVLDIIPEEYKEMMVNDDGTAKEE